MLKKTPNNSIPFQHLISVTSALWVLFLNTFFSTIASWGSQYLFFFNIKHTVGLKKEISRLNLLSLLRFTASFWFFPLTAYQDHDKLLQITLFPQQRSNAYVGVKARNCLGNDKCTPWQFIVNFLGKLALNEIKGNVLSRTAVGQTQTLAGPGEAAANSSTWILWAQQDSAV